MNTEEFTNTLLILRGIDREDCCPECTGLGTAVYGSTATWRGGVGGQAMTSDVCNKCWGSGSKSRPWKSWREGLEYIEKISAEADELEKSETLSGYDHMFDKLVTEKGWSAARANAFTVAKATDARIVEIETALRDEREACAKIADRFGMADGYNFPEESEATAMTIAALIRKRSAADD